ncbi:hypothetical protein [Rhizobium leguminosarum]|uniref:hypothetical protein n=1 Tax=Rhizobium leguminosarum TaxID=384 RepID=UPI0021BC3193|nr:hypothetical protein [Rhizobium leguminosarum]
MIRCLAACFFVLFGSAGALASQVTIATWNLGWHMDLETAQHWIEECSKNYVAGPATGKLKASQEAGFKPGWDINASKIEGWDVSRLPVCNVYFAAGSVRVNIEAYRKRQEQIANFISRSLPADIIAFQEVSGEQSVREVLPNGGVEYDFCPVTGYKVQRLVIAWKKTLGEKVSCAIEHALSLPANPDDKRPRPGLALTLKIDGKLLRIMDVHLKSSCVSPFDGGNLRGQPGTARSCNNRSTRSKAGLRARRPMEPRSFSSAISIATSGMSSATSDRPGPTPAELRRRGRRACYPALS